MGRPGLTWLCLLPLIGAAGCSSKGKLDAAADAVVEALRKNNLQAFEALAHPDLLKRQRPGTFGALSGAVGRLGAFKDKSMVGISVHSGGVRKGTYALSFAKGTVTMELALKEGKLYRLTFQGKSLLRRLQLVAEKGSGALRVRSFRWLNDGAREGPFQVEETIRFELQMDGLRRDSKGAVGVRVGLMAVSPVGKVVVDEVSLAEATASTVRGEFQLPEPGRYRIDLTITDVNATASLEHRVTAEAEPPPETTAEPGETPE